MITRRHFVSRILGSSLFGLVTLMTTAAAAPLRPRKTSQKPKLRINKALFVSLVGQTFLLTDGDAGQYSAWVRLTQVHDDYLTSDTEQFSVEFQAEPGVVFPEGIYHLEHASTGRLTLFLQPSERDSTGTYYEAPFNLLISYVDPLSSHYTG
jgi:hypothetical protein